MNSFRSKKIKKYTLGEKLKESREKKSWSLGFIAKRTSIPLKYLDALENGEWHNLPGNVYLKNFLKKYSTELGLNFKLCYQQYQRESSLKTKIKIKKNKFQFKNIRDKFFDFITPRKLRIFLIIIIFIVFAYFLYFEISEYIRAPKLIITYPEQNISTEENLIKIQGSTEPEAFLFVNDQEVGVSESGDFFIDVKLKLGLNKFRIISQRKHSQKNLQEVIIYKK
ncbi:helix-turn-helix domain-containing protein [bacterium]|nr:helix-turn-helix domain-containing protein [bacterium]